MKLKFLSYLMVAVGIWNQELTNGSRTADYTGHLNKLWQRQSLQKS